MELSIIIPTYDEARKIGRDISAAARFLSTRMGGGEIIIADDGSRDATLKVARETPVPAGVTIQVLQAAEHKGKGHALRCGMAASQGTFVMFADSGLTTPYENVMRGLDLIRGGRCQIAHGSRKLPESVVRIPQHLDRKIASVVFRCMLRLLLPIPRDLTDTQCGFKVYQGDIARMLSRECIADGFLFDVEVLLRARRHGFTVREFPIEWSCDRDSRLTFRHNSFSILHEILAVRRALGSEGKP
jgi:dolichyl-phosphate beta-glucosyltransferase